MRKTGKIKVLDFILDYCLETNEEDKKYQCINNGNILKLRIEYKDYTVCLYDHEWFIFPRDVIVIEALEQLLKEFN